MSPFGSMRNASSVPGGLEGLEKVFGRGETNPALLDQLRSRLVSETVAHHAYDLLLRKGLGRAALGHL